jgi:hypothetical protein
VKNVLGSQFYEFEVHGLLAFLSEGGSELVIDIVFGIDAAVAAHLCSASCSTDSRTTQSSGTRNPGAGYGRWRNRDRGEPG